MSSMNSSSSGIFPNFLNQGNNVASVKASNHIVANLLSFLLVALEAPCYEKKVYNNVDSLFQYIK